MVDGRDLASAFATPRLQAALPELQQDIEKLKQGIDQQAYALLRTGTLTAEQALAFWQQRFAYENLLKRMTTRVRVAQAAGERVAEQLNMEN